MSRTRAEVGELVALMFDRLEEDDLVVLDAMLLVEVDGEADEDETYSEILLETTADRTTIVRGMLDMAQDLYMSDEDDD